MSYNGSGTFLINSAGQPVVPGTTITTTAFNALTADLASGLTTAMTKDGQTVPTANIPMGGFKLTGLGAGTSATDAAQFGQLQNAPVATLITVSGADTITGTLVQTLTAYATGQQFSFVAAGTNTTAVTLNIDGLGAKAVTRTGAVALAAGALVSGQMAIVEYDGTRFQLINANAFTNLTVSGALTVGTTLAVTGVATLTAQPILSSLTASLPVFSDASKGLVSNAMTGTGSVMMSASPTTTGTLTAAAINASGLVAMAGAATVGTTLGVTGTSTMAAINASGSVTLSGSSFFRSPTTSNTPGTFNFYLAASGIREGTAGDFNIDTYNGGWGARLTVSQAGAVTIPGVTTIGAASAGVGTLTINNAVQPTIYLAKTNATAATWQIYNNGNLGFSDGTNTPLYFVGADSVFGGAIKANGTGTFISGIALGTSSVQGSVIYFGSSVVSAGAGTYPLKWNSSTGIVTYDTSSRLVKENIEDSPYGLAEVLQLKPRKYYRTDDQRNEIGLVADEVQTVLPEFVPLVPKSLFTKDEADIEMIAGGVYYDKLTSVLVKAIQELAADFQSYKNSHP